MAIPITERRTRRRFLGDLATGVAGTTILSPPAAARGRGPRRTKGRTVAIFGGGVAGLTAAHELAERGFTVTVYERRAFGGKARSVEVPASARGPRRALPGEHGFRIEFGFYRNLPDTMRRIPFGSARGNVLDNLVPAPQISASRIGRDDLVLPIGATDPRPYTPDQIRQLVVGLGLQTRIPAPAVARFADRFVVFLSSCDARRGGQWEQTPWGDFIGADEFTDDYRRVLADIPTHFLQASRAERTSTKFAGRIFEAFLYTTLARGSDSPFDQVFDRPTNEAWIDPWLQVLRGRGVDLRLGHAVTALDLQDGRITGARVRTPGGVRRVQADWYLCALPVERARRLWSRAILAADPGLGRMQRLQTAWMNGIQFYLRRPTPLVKGHILYLDSPWALSSISQAQFWARPFADRYGDGRARDSVSVDISDWSTPGIVYGKPARECRTGEIAREVWEQMKRHLNDAGRAPLDDALLLSWHLDPGLVVRRGRLHSEDPLVLPTAGAWADQPDVTTAIPNLLLAGDYVRGDWEMANMEAANASGRQATNALLERAGSTQAPCAVLPHHRPPEWEPLKRIDAERYARGQPNLFDGEP